MKPLLSPFCLLFGLLLPQKGQFPPASERDLDEGRQRLAEEEDSGPRQVTSLSRTVLEGYFDVADYDSSGMISFREARKALSVDRAGFAFYDTSRNGLIDLDEFTARYSSALVTGDELPEPIADRDSEQQPPRTAAQLRLAFDTSPDGIIDPEELSTILASYEREDLDAADTLERLDVDESGALELSELDGLAPLLFVTNTLGLVGQEFPDGERPLEREIKTLSDLFGERIIRKSETNAATLPPQIVGPLDHFRRLDFNDDGVIGYEDLDSLMRPIHSTIRLNTVVATLDVDEDGLVSPEEFWSAMGD